MVRARYTPGRGDIVWLDFDPTRGHEQKGVRPALVITPKIYNAKSGLALVCPITAQRKQYSFEVDLVSTQTAGVVLADHVRSVDWKVRHARYVETVPAIVANEVEAKLRVLIIEE